MESRGIGASHCLKKDRISEDEQSDENTSRYKVLINEYSQGSESHVHKRGTGQNNIKKYSSNGLQFLKDTDVSGSQLQGDISNISNTSQSSTGHELHKISHTIITEKHLMDEKSSNRTSSFYVEDLSAEDEVYTFQCPENYTRQSLVNQTFDFGNISKIVDVKTSEVLQLNVLSVENKSLTLAMPKKGKTGVLIKLPLKGHILIKKVVKTSFHHHESANEDDCMFETSDILSKDLKSRHPLLGINWKTHIDLADEAFKKQNKKIKKEIKKKLKVKKLKIVEERKI